MHPTHPPLAARNAPRAFASLLVLLLSFASSARAQIEPLPSGLFAFPGSNPSPPSAVSAGLAMSDRWLGDEAFDNPATGAHRSGVISPLLQHIGRQDLRAANRDYSGTVVFVDFAGAELGLPSRGPWAVDLYASQPVLRHEDDAFTRGELGAPEPPAQIATHTESREVRFGAAASWRTERLAIGIAPEWNYRKDDLRLDETSGSPMSGTRRLEISGGRPGAQVGACWTAVADSSARVRVGVQVRYVPALGMDGTLTEDLASGSSASDVHVDRKSAWEGGLSADAHLGPALRIVAGLGGRTAQDWHGAGVSTGASAEGAVGGEFHDWRDPWTARFGIGLESHPGTPEPRATRVGIGFGWSAGDVRFDLGALRRTITRPGSPTSSDDRVVGSVTLAW